MSKRISWKKGMRLTDEVLSMSDNCTSELIGKALVLSAGGNFGLFPNSRPFSLSLDINKNIIDVVSINCLGITRDGTLIDVNFDTNYTNSFDTRTVIPGSNEDAVFILCVSSTGEWRDTNDGLCEPTYSFNIIDENTSVPANSLPIARIVYDEYCWRMDEIDFVPPCLFVSSHDKYEELYSRFKQLLGKLDTILPHKFITEQKEALKIYWPIVQQLAITIDKEKYFMSPMMLLGSIQKCISGFVLACSLDDYITLGDPEIFQNYVRTPYSYKNVYKKIKEGLELCTSISVKIDGFEEEEPAPKPKQTLSSPTLSSDQLNQSTKTGRIKLTVGNVPDGAELYYSTDGAEPSILSKKGNVITVDPHFKSDKNPEPDKQITVKLRYEYNGSNSSIVSYQINVHKDYKSYICI